MRWRKAGRIGFAGPHVHHLVQDGKILARVQETAGGWFWYGGGRNTAATPTTLENAKAAALEHILCLETTR